jgi:hypothetical protein
MFLLYWQNFSLGKWSGSPLEGFITAKYFIIYCHRIWFRSGSVFSPRHQRIWADSFTPWPIDPQGKITARSRTPFCLCTRYPLLLLERLFAVLGLNLFFGYFHSERSLWQMTELFVIIGKKNIGLTTWGMKLIIIILLSSQLPSQRKYVAHPGPGPIDSCWLEVKLCPCLTKHYVMKACGRMDV